MLLSRSLCRFPFQLGLTCLLMLGGAIAVSAREPDRTIDVWPDLAPGETTRSKGEALPRRPRENPPATRVAKITRPTLAAFLPPAKQRNGVAVIIAPGGGYNYVVTDKEGSEAAAWLNSLGVSCFVLHYRTKDGTAASKADPAARPHQDAQRAIRLVRSQAEALDLRADAIGVMGFSAGGQLAALAATGFEQRTYQPIDQVDQVSARPDFAILVYPWRLLDSKGNLADRFPVGKQTPPTILIHAHNDSATSLSSVQFYTAMKRHGRPAELHIFETGGHGYGMRPVAGSNIHLWPRRVDDWLHARKLISADSNK